MSQDNIVIIGASGGVGSSLVKLEREKGNQVFAGVRDLALFESLQEADGLAAKEVDACDWDSLRQFADAAEERLGRIDGVAVCVGSILLKAAHLTSKQEFDDVIETNLSSCFGLLKAVAKKMMKRGGSIVFCSSAAARHGLPNHEAIAAAKAGVIGLTLSAAASYANYGIRVNCVAPGLVRSKMSAGILENEMALQASQSMHALGRIGEPEEVARAISWLLDSQQSWVTGQVIGVDGGLAAVQSKGLRGRK